VRERRERLGLAPEALAQDLGSLVLRVQDLQRDRAPERRVLRAVHAPDTALAEERLHAVALCDDLARTQLLARRLGVRHRRYGARNGRRWPAGKIAATSASA
jgi:hypothetical protein